MNEHDAMKKAIETGQPVAWPWVVPRRPGGSLKNLDENRVVSVSVEDLDVEAERRNTEYWKNRATNEGEKS